MSNVKTQNRPAQRAMMNNYQGTTRNQSNTPQSAPINSTCPAPAFTGIGILSSSTQSTADDALFFW